MNLKHGRFVIRSATEKDAPQLASWWNDGKVMAHAGFPKGLGQSVHNIAASLKNDSDDTRRRLMIELDGTAIGEMSYLLQEGQTAEIGIKICDFSEQDKGYGKILLSMLISFLLNDAGCRKIVLDTDYENKRAQHVYETLGFQKLRVNENAWKDQTGQWRSSVDYALVPKNFVSFL